MKRKILIIIAILILSSNSYAKTKEWHEHTGLYQYKMDRWNTSRLLEKLSFSANFITSFLPNTTKIISNADNNMELLKYYSVNLSICIDEINHKKDTKEIMQNSNIIDIAKFCTDSMKWN